MSKRNRRNFTAAEELALIRLDLIEQQTVSEICDKHKLRINQFYYYRSAFEIN
jgi:transposase-like protein